MEIHAIKDRNNIGRLHVSQGRMINGKYHSPELPISDFRKFIKENKYLRWLEQNDYFIEEQLSDNPHYLHDGFTVIETKATSREINDFIYKHQLIINYTPRGLRIHYWKANKSMLYILVSLASFMDCFLYLDNEILFDTDINKMDLELNSVGMYPLYR